MMSRRELNYPDWEAVLEDLTILQAGYVQHGNWDLEQIAKHLDDWLRFPMDGFPKASVPFTLLLVAMRNTVGPFLLRKMIRQGKMQDAAPTLPQTIYEKSPEPTAARAAVTQLQQTIGRFRENANPIHSSPVFGSMDKATAEQLQLVHFAHHLSWLSPQVDHGLSKIAR